VEIKGLCGVVMMVFAVVFGCPTVFIFNLEGGVELTTFLVTLVFFVLTFVLGGILVAWDFVERRKRR